MESSLKVIISPNLNFLELRTFLEFGPTGPHFVLIVFLGIPHKQLGISLKNARALYLAYHEGRGGYKRGSYRTKPWLLSVADKVQRQSDRYKIQYQGCKKKLGKRFIFF